MMTDSTSQVSRCQTPESQGVSSAALLRLLEAWETASLELHSFQLLRRGHILAEGWWEPYNASTPHRVYSLTKSFTSTAVGFALAEERLTLDAPVLSFFPNEAPANPSKYLQAMELRHLLTMMTGHAVDPQTGGSGNQAHDFLHCPVEYAPGTHFVYNNAASHMLAAIVQNMTGYRLQDYLTPRLFTPLGIADVTWNIAAFGIDAGANGLKLKTEDITRFGQFYLQQGLWDGVQLLPASWLRQATSPHIAFENQSEDYWHQGYGFQFWCGREGVFMGSGAFGQLCIIVPRHQIVIAITAAVRNTTQILNLLREHLLTSLDTAPIPEDPHTQAKLQTKLTALKLRGAEGTAASSLAPEISGRPYLLISNTPGFRTIRFDFAADAFCRIHIVNARGEHLLAGRMDGQWQRMRTRLLSAELEEVAIQCAWSHEDTFVFKLCVLQKPDCITVTCRFDGQLLRLQYKYNVGDPSPFSTEFLGWRTKF